MSLLFFGLVSTIIQGQCIEIEGNQTPTVNCNVAPEVCLQNACYGTVNEPFVGYTGFCGPMTIINNPQFFAFTPTDTIATIEIRVTSCDGSGNSALQSAIVPGCDWDIDSVLVCDAGTPVGGTMVMTYDQFVPFQTYFLIIDGSNGAICQYEISNVENVFEPEISQTLSDAGPDAVVCQGQDNFIATANPELDNANYYSWSLPWETDNVISGSNTLDVPVPDDAPIGTYTVEVFAYSGCDTVDMPWPTFEITIEEVADIQKDPFTFCPEDLPYSWHSQTINGPGVYMETFDNAAGCPFDSIWSVDVYPEVPVEEIDTVHCGAEFDYEGTTYDTDGTYPLQYPGQGLNGCDSSANLNIVLVDLDAQPEIFCEDSEVRIILTQLVYQPANAILDYAWYENGTLVPGETGQEYVVSFDGTITAEITVSVNGTPCVFPLEPIQVTIDDLLPEPPQLTHGDTMICPNAIATFEVIDQDPQVIEYIWAAPGGVSVTNDGSGMAMMDFTNADLENEICISATNECGESEQTCFMVELIQIPDVGIQVASDVCQDSVVAVVFDGEASNNAQFVWDFGEDATPQTESGEGPFNVTWSTGGQKIITVQVAEVGCDTISAQRVVEVEEISAPVINCNSTIGSITFSWNSVPGADQYVVEIEGESPIMTTDTFNTTTGLAPGESLTIYVYALTPGACASSISSFTCSAQDCPPPTIELSGVDTICLNNNVGPFNLYSVVNGDTTTGMWSGPGIIDGINGIFDPLDVSAGPGQHMLNFVFTDANNCTSQDVLNVIVYDSIQATFSMDSVICISDYTNVTYTGNASPGAVYSWNFEDAVVLSGSGAGPYELAWDSPGVKQVRLTVEENGCISEVFTSPIEIVPALQNPVINCVPSTSTVEFNWQLGPNADTVELNLIQGPAGMQTGNSIFFDNLNPGDTVMIELVIFSSGTCPDLRDTAMCIAQDCPMVTVEIDSVPPFCLEPGASAFDLSVDVVGGNGTGSWSGPGIIDDQAGTFDPIAAGAGSHQIVYTYSDQGCTFPDQIIIEINEVPTAVIEDTGLQLNCGNGNELVLDGSASVPVAGLVYTWTTPDGVISTNPTLQEITVGAPGTYQLNVSTPEGCADSTTVVVTQDADVPVADAGTDQVITCAQDTVLLGGNSSEGVDIIYAWSTADGSIITDGTRKEITVNAPGTYELVVTDTLNSCTSVDVVSVTEDVVLPIVSASVLDILDCDTESVTIFGEVEANGDPVEITWSTTDGNIVSGENTEEPAVNRPGTYTMVAVNLENGCVDSVLVEVMADDNIIQSIDTEVNQISCFGESDGSILISGIQGGQAPYSYEWGSGQTDSLLQGLTAGTYTVTVIDANGCSIEEAFSVIEPDALSFNAELQPDPNAVFFIGDTAQIVLSDLPDIGSIDTIIWTGHSTNGLCADEPECSFPVTSGTTVNVVVIDTNGCTAVDEVRIEVTVPRNVYVPNIFTPNGDDYNDFFTVFGSGNIVSVNNFQIYSRWGEVVFEIDSMSPNIPEAGWDGTINGNAAMPGVYIYSFTIRYDDGVEEQVKGDITLLR